MSAHAASSERCTVRAGQIYTTRTAKRGVRHVLIERVFGLADLYRDDPEASPYVYAHEVEADGTPAPGVDGNGMPCAMQFRVQLGFRDRVAMMPSFYTLATDKEKGHAEAEHQAIAEAANARAKAILDKETAGLQRASKEGVGKPQPRAAKRPVAASLGDAPKHDGVGAPAGGVKNAAQKAWETRRRMAAERKSAS